jgi:hypothetical protein
MHLNTEQILWALMLAAYLILLIVLLGRDRVRLFPFFTAATALSTVTLLANHLLSGKLTTLAYYWQSYTGLGFESILGILVLIELTRRVFASGKAGLLLEPAGWLAATLATVAGSLGAVWAWGPWPAWKALNAQPAQFHLLLVILIAMKSQLFVSILTVLVCLLLLIFGRRFGFAWNTQVQQIAVGLSTNALAFLIVQAISQSINSRVHIGSRQEYEHIVHLFTNMENARTALGVLVLVWWTAWLWRDELSPAAEPPVIEDPPETGRATPDLLPESGLVGEPEIES